MIFNDRFRRVQCSLLTINIFTVSDIEQVNFIVIYKTEFDAIVFINPKTPHVFATRLQLFGL